jgi:hypothetical protein
MKLRYVLEVKRPIELVSILTKRFCGNGHLSFEGNLTCCDFNAIPGSSFDETFILKRNTIAPQQDFVILPLNEVVMKLLQSDILYRVGLRRRVIHVQIEHDCNLVFGAYDQFGDGLVWVDASIGLELLGQLTAEGVIRRYYQSEH